MKPTMRAKHKVVSCIALRNVAQACIPTETVLQGCSNSRMPGDMPDLRSQQAAVQVLINVMPQATMLVVLFQVRCWTIQSPTFGQNSGGDLAQANTVDMFIFIQPCFVAMR